jgi:hypothetical protein
MVSERTGDNGGGGVSAGRSTGAALRDRRREFTAGSHPTAISSRRRGSYSAAIISSVRGHPALIKQAKAGVATSVDAAIPATYAAFRRLRVPMKKFV